MQDFMFSIPQNIVFGKGSLRKLPALLQNKVQGKVLIISDRGLEKAGAVKKITDILDEAGVQHEEFLDIEPNPSVETVKAATAVYKKSKAAGIIALGGGSPMDVAKAVGVLAVYGKEITDYEGADKVPGKTLPIIAIPTTAGTGSEVTAFAVITDKARNYKLTVFSYELVPCYALLDPEMIMSLPHSIAAATGMDALVHAIEAYLSKAASPFTDAMAEKAMKLIGKNIRRFVADRSNEEAASAMMLASTFAGIAFAWARLGNVHAMAHPLGGFFNVPHGVANAILLPTVLEYNALADNGRYEIIYDLIKESKEKEYYFDPYTLVREVKRLTGELGIPESLSQVGVTEDKIPEMAADAMKSGNIAVNPRKSNIRDIEMLYRKAM
jgi:alcohol dehydrogenase